MKITKSMNVVPALTAVPWMDGLEVPPGTLVELGGRIYLNVHRTGFNEQDPTMEGAGYTKALEGAGLITALINYSKET